MADEKQNAPAPDGAPPAPVQSISTKIPLMSRMTGVAKMANKLTEKVHAKREVNAELAAASASAAPAGPQDASASAPTPLAQMHILKHLLEKEKLSRREEQRNHSSSVGLFRSRLAEMEKRFQEADRKRVEAETKSAEIDKRVQAAVAQSDAAWQRKLEEQKAEFEKDKQDVAKLHKSSIGQFKARIDRLIAENNALRKGVPVASLPEPEPVGPSIEMEAALSAAQSRVVELEAQIINLSDRLDAEREEKEELQDQLDAIGGVKRPKSKARLEAAATERQKMMDAQRLKFEKQMAELRDLYEQKLGAAENTAQDALATLTQKHQDEMRTLLSNMDELEVAIRTLRRENEAVLRAKKGEEKVTASAKDGRDLSRAIAEYERQMRQLRTDKDSELAALKDAHEKEVRRHQIDKERLVKELATKQERAIIEVKAEHEKTVAKLFKEKEAALVRARQDFDVELEEVRRQHGEVVLARERDTDAVRQQVLDCERRIRGYQEELLAARKNIKELEQEVDQIYINTYQSGLKASKSMRDLKSETHNLEKLVSDLQEVRLERDTLKEKLGTLTAEHASAAAELDKARRQLALNSDAVQRLTTLEKDFESLRKVQKSLSANLEKEQDLRKEYESQLSEITAAYGDVPSFRKKYEELDAEVKTLKEDAAQALLHLEELEAIANDLRDQVSQKDLKIANLEVALSDKEYDADVLRANLEHNRKVHQDTNQELLEIINGSSDLSQIRKLLKATQLRKSKGMTGSARDLLAAQRDGKLRDDDLDEAVVIPQRGAKAAAANQKYR